MNESLMSESQISILQQLSNLKRVAYIDRSMIPSQGELTEVLNNTSN